MGRALRADAAPAAKIGGLPLNNEKYFSTRRWITAAEKSNPGSYPANIPRSLRI
jgi:hypothetical protein